MGWSYLPDPEEFADVAKHLIENHRAFTLSEFERTWKRWSESTCSLCRKPLGYGTKFYGDPDQGTGEHAACVWEESEKRSNAFKGTSK